MSAPRAGITCRRGCATCWGGCSRTVHDYVQQLYHTLGANDSAGRSIN